MQSTGLADPVSYIQSHREHLLCWFTCQCGVRSFSSHKGFPVLQYVYVGKLHGLQPISQHPKELHTDKAIYSYSPS